MAKLIELKEAAEKMGLSPEQLTEMVDNKEIFGYRDGSSWKFKPSEIERVVAEKGLTLADDLPAAASAAVGAVKDAADDLIDVDELRLDDDGADDADSILVTEEELGRSDESTGSTIIGKTDLGVSSADSDIKLSDETLSVADGGSDLSLSIDGGSDLSLAADGGSDLSLDGGSDLSLADSDLDLTSAVAGASDVLAGDSDLMSVADGGSGGISGGSGIDLSLDDDLGAGSGGSSLAMSASGLSLDDDLKLDGDSGASGMGADSSLDLDLDDDDLLLGSGTGSDITLGASDSGINLTNPADSGISLEGAPSDLGSGLDLGGDDDMIELEMDPADPDDLTEAGTDDEFMLTPVVGDGDLDEESDDSGSQVIALDSDEFEESAATMLVADDDGGLVMDADDDGFGDLATGVAVVGSGAAAGVASGAAAAEEADFSVWNILSLSMLSVFMGLGALLALDIIRNIWSWDQPFSVNNSLMDLLVGLF